MSDAPAVIERAAGHSGELVPRRSSAGLEIIANGVFLVSDANAASSRAPVTAALDHVPGGGLDVLIGGLGLGDALDEALASPRVAGVTVVELEPVVVRWFRRYAGGRARRAASGERVGRVRVLVADVADVLAADPARWDVVALDTDNGPRWLVREQNAGLYTEAGVRRAAAALRPGGAAVFWSPGRDDAFERLLRGVFPRVEVEAAYDLVDGRLHDYAVCVCLQGAPRGVD